MKVHTIISLGIISLTLNEGAWGNLLHGNFARDPSSGSFVGGAQRNPSSIIKSAGVNSNSSAFVPDKIQQKIQNKQTDQEKSEAMNRTNTEDSKKGSAAKFFSVRKDKNGREVLGAPLDPNSMRNMNGQRVAVKPDATGKVFLGTINTQLGDDLYRNATVQGNGNQYVKANQAFPGNDPVGIIMDGQGAKGSDLGMKREAGLREYAAGAMTQNQAEQSGGMANIFLKLLVYQPVANKVASLFGGGGGGGGGGMGGADTGQGRSSGKGPVGAAPAPSK